MFTFRCTKPFPGVTYREMDSRNGDLWTRIYFYCGKAPFGSFAFPGTGSAIEAERHGFY